MTTETLSEEVVEQSLAGYQRAQQRFDGQIQPAQGDVGLLSVGDGLDVLKAAPMDDLGFHSIDIDVRDILQTPQLLARILLFHNVNRETYQPAVLVPKPGAGNEHVLRLSVLPVDFVPDVGLTQGISLGTALEAEGQAQGFGGHGNGNGPSGFEPGHLTSAIAAGVDQESALALRQLGDVRSHQVISRGVPQVLKLLGRLSDLPISSTNELDTTHFQPGDRLPLVWHPSLETEDGAARATFKGPDASMPGAIDLLIGRAFYDMTDIEIDRTSQHIELAIRGVQG